MYWVVMPVSFWGKYDRGLGLNSLRLLARHMDVWKGSRGAYICKLMKGMSSLDAITCVHMIACDSKGVGVQFWTHACQIWHPLKMSGDAISTAAFHMRYGWNLRGHSNRGHVCKRVAAMEKKLNKR